MVTSNNITDKKVVRMTEPNNSIVPQRTLIGEVNEHITCSLCSGYYIDATTIVECLHSFCRSCIIKHLQVKSYCPVCEMMINAAKPNIKLDKALQDIVYKLVPGLFQKEMERRQQFYSSRPGPAATATPEQRGEDTERIIFSPEDVISFSLEYVDATDNDSISSKSSDSNDQQPGTGVPRRYLQCPAVVNISHLKKFLSMKFDIDSNQFAIDILYKRVSLQDYYTLMDIAYIYNWKRNEPMRFFYQIIDFVAIRNRLFDINRKGSHFRDRKSSLTPTDDTSAHSPAQNVNEQGSEISSGTDSPMPDDKNLKKASDILMNNNECNEQVKDSNSAISKNTDEDVEKSQFLNSFELKAKSCITPKSSPVKDCVSTPLNEGERNLPEPVKTEENPKRKHQSPPTSAQELKKLKLDLDKPKVPNATTPIAKAGLKVTPDVQNKMKETEVMLSNSLTIPTVSNSVTSNISATTVKDVKQQFDQVFTSKVNLPQNNSAKKALPGPLNISSPKQKVIDTSSPAMTPTQTHSSSTKALSPLKLQKPKLESQMLVPKIPEPFKSTVKKIPDLKPSMPSSQIISQNKPINKVRMDLLANNSDPTIDRSKILSQVKSCLSSATVAQTSGDPLKTLFDSCKINIPSSLSITLTDQKLEAQNQNEQPHSGDTKNVVNKNLSTAGNTVSHKAPSPPVHNYIEILKLPDSDPKKPSSKPDNSIESNAEGKSPVIKNENMSTNSAVTNKPSNKPGESPKGPVPNLKPIADTKHAKQSGNSSYSSPITFQQTFEKQLQSLQSDKKTKLPKTKTQVPKLVPATPKSVNVATKLNNPNRTASFALSTPDNKAGSALDLSNPYSIQNQLGVHAKVFETMQSIANLAKKQNLPSKVTSPTQAQSIKPANVATESTPFKGPALSNTTQLKHDQNISSGNQCNPLRQEQITRINQVKQPHNFNVAVSSPNYQSNAMAVNTTNPSPRSNTRSPSSSPKLVIAEEKQTSSTPIDQTINQSNQISSTQQTNIYTPRIDTTKVTAGPSKTSLKPVKPIMPSSKPTAIRQPTIPNVKTNTPINTSNSDSHYLSQPQLISAHALLRQMEIRNAWLKASQYMSNMSHQSPQNDFNNKDK